MLTKVLDGYAEQDAAPGTFEVLVVADLAEPAPAAVQEAIGERPYPVRRVTAKVPGLSANRNAGWRAAQAPIILFTDNDTIPTRGLVSEHVEWHRRYPGDSTVVIGPVRWARGINVTPFMKWLDHGIQFDFHSIEGTGASWAHVYGANSSIKKHFLELVGGYDEARLPYGYEDLDWGYRARSHGIRVMLNRNAVVDHWREMTVDHWRARANRLAVSEWTFCQLHPDFPPWYHRLFSEAADAPPQNHYAATLTRFVPRGVPLLGRRVWRRADLYWRQQIGAPFLATWADLAAGKTLDLQPAVSALIERGSNPGGS